MRQREQNLNISPDPTPHFGQAISVPKWRTWTVTLVPGRSAFTSDTSQDAWMPRIWR